MGFTRLLLIDDDEEDQEIFQEALKEASVAATCLMYSAASRALEDLLSGKIRPELIFLDINMPGMNGLQLLPELKKQELLRDIPVIIYTTSSNWQTIQETRTLGAADFITKPGDLGVLVRVLRKILD